MTAFVPSSEVFKTHGFQPKKSTLTKLVTRSSNISKESDKKVTKVKKDKTLKKTEKAAQ